ncbi:hypothetical protein FMM05_07410 [Flavobacterium zepuense]|uniref:Uncharacterized protein n=1 Tax=Flavobacterium zepuense TaxID=2593302 RepID=A0A552V3R7_9FLAO|nr:hypothetical protein [Flavobacterium zepuense]TRW25130.1 hypothetical protein FMM05_07410 [Flavobacterium zepuense]
MATRVITKVSVSKDKTVVTKETITATKAGAKEKTTYSDRLIDTRKQAVQNIEKAIFYMLLIFMAIYFIKEDAVLAFSGQAASGHSLIDAMQSIVLIICCLAALRYSLSKRADSFQSIFALLFCVSAYVLLVEQGTYFVSDFDYTIWSAIATGIISFTLLQLYRNRLFLAHDFEMYFKTKSYGVACFAILTIVLLPYFFNDDVFMHSHLNEMPGSFGEMLIEYVQTFGYVFLLIAITELVVKIKQKDTLDEDVFR